MTSVRKDVEKLEPSIIIGRKIKWCRHFGKNKKKLNKWQLFKMLKTQSIIIHQSHSYTEESWKHMFRAPGWLGLFSIRLLIWAQVVTSGLWDPAPHQALHWAWSVLNILSHTATLENNMEVPQKVKIDIPYNPAIALLGIYPEDTYILIRRSTCTPIL